MPHSGLTNSTTYFGKASTEKHPPKWHFLSSIDRYTRTKGSTIDGWMDAWWMPSMNNNIFFDAICVCTALYMYRGCILYALRQTENIPFEWMMNYLLLCASTSFLFFFISFFYLLLAKCIRISNIESKLLQLRSLTHNSIFGRFSNFVLLNDNAQQTKHMWEKLSVDCHWHCYCYCHYHYHCRLVRHSMCFKSTQMRMRMWNVTLLFYEMVGRVSSSSSIRFGWFCLHFRRKITAQSDIMLWMVHSIRSALMPDAVILCAHRSRTHNSI